MQVQMQQEIRKAGKLPVQSRAGIFAEPVLWMRPSEDVVSPDGEHQSGNGSEAACYVCHLPGLRRGIRLRLGIDAYGKAHS